MPSDVSVQWSITTDIQRKSANEHRAARAERTRSGARPTKHLTPLPSGNTAQADWTGREAEPPPNASLTPLPSGNTAQADWTGREAEPPPNASLTPLPSGNTAQADWTGREAEDPVGVI